MSRHMNGAPPPPFDDDAEEDTGTRLFLGDRRRLLVRSARRWTWFDEAWTRIRVAWHVLRRGVG